MEEEGDMVPLTVPVGEGSPESEPVRLPVADTVAHSVAVPVAVGLGEMLPVAVEKLEGVRPLLADEAKDRLALLENEPLDVKQPVVEELAVGLAV